MQRRGRTVKIKFEWFNIEGHSTGSSQEEYVSIKHALEVLKRNGKIELSAKDLVTGAVFHSESTHSKIVITIIHVSK